MAMKQKSLCLIMKLEMKYLCEVSSSSKRKTGQYGLTSSALFMILKKSKYSNILPFFKNVH
jgi:hypothetical protein